MEKKHISKLNIFANIFRENLNKKNDEYALLKYKIGNSYTDYLSTGKIEVKARKGSAYINLTPDQILKDEDMIQYFHPLDVLIISKLSIETKIPTIYKIESISKSRRSLSYINNISQEVNNISFDELFINKTLINSFSNEDVYKIGFLCHEDHCNQISSLL